MPVLNANHGVREARSRARWAVSLLACLGAVAGVITLTAADADADAGADVSVWSTHDGVEAQTDPYVGAANQAVADAQEVPNAADCIDTPTKPPMQSCKVREHRATVDGMLDGPSDAVPPVTETGVPGPCLSVDDRAATCVRGGRNSADGRTYYKGSGPPEYHWEHQRASVQSTNHRVVKVNYNSMRIRYRGNGGIYMKTRDGRVDDEGDLHYWGSYDMLVSDSFSARYRISYCHNVNDANAVRCAYDWVR